MEIHPFLHQAEMNRSAGFHKSGILRSFLFSKAYFQSSNAAVILMKAVGAQIQRAACDQHCVVKGDAVIFDDLDRFIFAISG